MTQAIHRAAAEGFQRASDAYDRGRPTYPPAAVDALVRRLQISQGNTVVDLGAGTGKLTELLVPTGARILAVEPVDAMREVLRHRRLVGVELLKGQAEAIPVPDHSVHAVVVAQAFHWFDGARALTEVHRVLMKGGKLGLIWNRRQDGHPWEKEFSTLLEKYQGDAPSYRSGDWRKAFQFSPQFTALQEESFSHQQNLSRSGIIDRIASISYIAALPESDQGRVLQQFQKILDTNPETQSKTEISLRYVTEFYWTEAL